MISQFPAPEIMPSLPVAMFPSHVHDGIYLSATGSQNKLFLPQVAFVTVLYHSSRRGAKTDTQHNVNATQSVVKTVLFME